MFTCPERVVRDGRLVCFEGQIIGDDEAEALGLTGAPAPASDAPKEPTAAEIKAELDELGVAYDRKAKKGELVELLAAAKATPAAPEKPEVPEDPEDPEKPERPEAPEGSDEPGDGGDE
ncbi:hypothetical protein [Adlercreutzia shanghongiae]|uniref:HeH/LEM domain-containing protein n=1 Tax=Adlercreutzia shanghongiae TaxID=3111773 RepID=A0ABU6IW36_9ACTN|nr:hypothetical protein [Adlercreutzia sp. R22]MEC4294041.1 hypothetical protein [Adlercreutzia sp. R22]